MGIRTALYVACDLCGDLLEGADAEPLHFESETKARESAFGNGWCEYRDQLLCGGICRERAETDAERAVADRVRVGDGQVNREDVAATLPNLLLEVYGEAVAQDIAASDAYGALVYRVGQRLKAGEEFKEIIDQLNADDVDFAPEAIDPAAFLAARIAEL